MAGINKTFHPAVLKLRGSLSKLPHLCQNAEAEYRLQLLLLQQLSSDNKRLLLSLYTCLYMVVRQSDNKCGKDCICICPIPSKVQRIKKQLYSYCIRHRKCVTSSNYLSWHYLSFFKHLKVQLISFLKEIT